MEDLIKDDATFEVYHNSEGAEILNENRVLMSYPSEKSSFQVFLGADGDYDLYFEGEDKTTDTKTGTDTTGTKPKYDPEKIAQGITASAGALGSVASTIQAFKGDGSKPKSAKRQLKDVCGRKPLLKKKRAEYDKCVVNYNAGNVQRMAQQQQETASTTTQAETTPTPDNKKRNLIIGVVVVGLLVTAFVGYKKGWFGSKAG